MSYDYEIDFRGNGIRLFALKMLYYFGWACSVVFALALLMGLAFPEDWWLVGFLGSLFSWYESLPGLVLSVVLVAMAIDAVDFFRLQNTLVFGRKLECAPPWSSMVKPVFDMILILVTFGLARPVVKTWSVRRWWGFFHYEKQKDRKLRNRAGYVEAFALWGARLLILPLVPATLGAIMIPLRYFEYRWEYSGLEVPLESGAYARMKFRGSFVQFLGVALLGWFLTLITLGLYGSWANVRTWRWVSRNTSTGKM